MKKTMELLKSKIADADMVFVGIGQEMQVQLGTIMKDEQFQDISIQIDQNSDLQWVYPYFIKAFLERLPLNDLEKAYRNLLELIQDKNYFIVSLSTDDVLKKMGYREDRLVFPCGGYSKLQCEHNCDGTLYDIPVELWNDIQDCIDGKKQLGTLKQPTCPVCGSPLVFNLYGQQSYNEQGYLEQWKLYKLWLQGTVNKKLCILELGVGMEFPSVIRWPMEKVCYYNQKSSFFRVHSSLYQLTKDIDDRGYAVDRNPISFLNQEDK